jgi:urease accessory protein
MSLARLLQLASPALPVGAYSYSQGLEAAIEAGIVTDAASAESWIGDVLQFSVASLEAPLLYRMMTEPESAAALNALFLATRETAELRAETAQMGHSLRLLLAEFEADAPAMDELAYPTAFAAAVLQWKLDPKEALVAYLWAWLENQVMAAVKAVPLGQTAGQKILLSLGARLETLAADAPSTREEQWSNFTPGLALLSSRHETQYSRLFRS